MSASRLLAVAACALACALPSVAAAEDITIGLFAPTAPFEGSGDRVSFVNAVADHLAGAAGGAKVNGKVYASASAFSAAARKGEIQFAIVDAPYAAANGLPYTILAAALRGGSGSASWQLVAKSSIGSIRDLRGARVAIPSTGAKAQAFVTNALLSGEVETSYFASITEAADARSAVTMITVGKADAAFVPTGVEAPSGTRRLLTLPSVGWPMFVALPAADGKLSAAFATRIKSFGGGGGFSGFGDAGAGNYRSLAGSFGRSNKKGLMALPPPARLSVKDLLTGRSFTVPQQDVLELVEPPPPPVADKK
ncbi:MAG: phosphate/phosphite/phosphonate ABC transporter substrate-binding protein [Deltaproteobacteria bacterium]|nr:phosphate/phosphite/phosphonate ABC transporter substrate-binding protein [Kofleriaceae bacterium]